MEGDFYGRVLGEGAIAISGGAAALLARTGLVESVAYNGVGDYTVFLRAPGIRRAQQDGTGFVPIPTAYFQPQNAIALSQWSTPTETSVRVQWFDRTGAPVDVSFNVLIRQTTDKFIP
jgi:hypothetical protein